MTNEFGWLVGLVGCQLGWLVVVQLVVVKVVGWLVGLVGLVWLVGWVGWLRGCFESGAMAPVGGAPA